GRSCQALLVGRGGFHNGVAGACWPAVSVGAGIGCSTGLVVPGRGRQMAARMITADTSTRSQTPRRTRPGGAASPGVGLEGVVIRETGTTRSCLLGWTRS